MARTKPRKLNRGTLLAMAAASLALAAIVFREPNPDLMNRLADDMLVFSAVVFGAKALQVARSYSLLLPGTDEEAQGRRTPGTENLATFDALAPTFVVSTLALAAALPLRLAVAVGPTAAPNALEGLAQALSVVGVGVSVSTTTTEVFFHAARSLAGGAVFFLVGLQLLVLLASVLVLLQARQEAKTREWESARDTLKHRRAS